MPGEAAMIIHNYEVWTGHIVSMAELESGYLKGWLRPEDYDIKQQVGDSSTTFYYENFHRDSSQGPLPRGFTRAATPRGLPIPLLIPSFFLV